MKMNIKRLRRLNPYLAALIVTSKVIPTELEVQLKQLLTDNSQPAEQLKAFILRNENQESVYVDPDERLVLPNFKYKTLDVPYLDKKYPDLVFICNFLIPYLVMMHSKRITDKLLDVKALHAFIKAHQPDPPTTLYRAQSLKYTSEDNRFKKMLSIISRSHFRHVPKSFPEYYELTALPYAGYARTPELARKAMYGSGIFGNIGDSFIFKLKVQPILDIQAYSEMVLDVFQKVLNDVPKALNNLKVYGMTEGEVLAPVPKTKLSIKDDILLFQYEGKTFSPNEFLNAPESNISTKHAVVLVNIPYAGPTVHRKYRIPKKNFDNMIEWFARKPKEEFAMTVPDLKVTPKKPRSDFKSDPGLSQKIGFPVYVYTW